MIYRDKVLQFSYEKLIPQLQKYNFYIILKLRVGKHTYIGRLLQIHDLSYAMTLDMGDGTIRQFPIVRIDEMEIVGNAKHDKDHNPFDWKKEMKLDGS